MKKLLIKLLCFSIISVFLFACKSEPREEGGKSKISAICRGEKAFFKKNGRYGTLEELVKDELVEDNFARNSGYIQSIKLTETGYFATAIPNNFTKAEMYYVDEKGLIKAHRGDVNVNPNDLDCEYPNGAKCPCYGD